MPAAYLTIVALLNGLSRLRDGRCPVEHFYRALFVYVRSLNANFKPNAAKLPANNF